MYRKRKVLKRHGIAQYAVKTVLWVCGSAVIAVHGTKKNVLDLSLTMKITSSV